MRVIAGTARGRPLRAPNGPATRPTSDLIRGAVFSMLDAEAYRRDFEPDEEGRFALALAWPRVLDLYAGTGALAVEALSRGCLHADLVDQATEASQVSQANLRSTGLAAQATVHRTGVALALARLTGPYNLVFVDPPYDDAAALPQVAGGLARPGFLSPGAVAVVEQPARSPELTSLGPLVLLRSRRHGGTRVSLFALTD